MEERTRENIIFDLGTIMNTVEGVNVLMDILEECHIGQHLNNTPEVIAKYNFGKELLDTMYEANENVAKAIIARLNNPMVEV